MYSLGMIFGHKNRQRALAILGCLALFYFVAGATLHHHTDGQDTACHVCQVLHVPALAAAALDLIPEALEATWHASAPENATPTDSFALHRASRAPPAIA